MSLTRSLITQQHRPILDQLLIRLGLRQGQHGQLPRRDARRDNRDAEGSRDVGQLSPAKSVTVTDLESPNLSDLESRNFRALDRVCTENLIRVADVMELPKLEE